VSGGGGPSGRLADAVEAGHLTQDDADVLLAVLDEATTNEEA
jgi:hypothetical protein